MFGYVTANWKELTDPEKERYGAVYCGICRGIRDGASQVARLGLSYDMAFLALLLMSLYEPEERSGRNHCPVHPLHRKPWIDNEYVRYAADMNTALAYYKALDDWEDDGSHRGKLFAGALADAYTAIEARWPRQCGAIEGCIRELSRMEREGERNPDLPAACFGFLMAELMVYREDLWERNLRELGFHLGRFIYLADAVLDYDADEKKGSYNPFLAHGEGKNPAQWEEFLVLAMARCTESYEKLPLVQDKALLDNILYSGVWIRYRTKTKEEGQHDEGSL